MENNEIYFLGQCAESDEITMFQSQNLEDLIDFKWNAFGFNFHLIGTTVHLVYLGFLFVYTMR